MVASEKHDYSPGHLVPCPVCHDLEEYMRTHKKASRVTPDRNTIRYGHADTGIPDADLHDSKR